jgi:hypothetical protein
MSQTEALAKLREPFKDEEIGKKPKISCTPCSKAQYKVCEKHTRRKCKECGNTLTSAHIHLDFVGHAHVRERLLKVDPLWNWEPLGLTDRGIPVLDETGGLWIRLTVAGMSRIGYGDAEGKRGPAAVKEAIGDAIRNAGQSFGIALDLWKREPVSAPAEVSSEEPVLTPEARAAEMRNVILAKAKKKGMGLPAVDGDFHSWSRGEQEFRKTTDITALEEYLGYLEAAK